MTPRRSGESVAVINNRAWTACGRRPTAPGAPPGFPPLERAHAINRADISIIERLASSYRFLKQDDKLIGVLKRWVSLDEKRSDIRVELGELYLAKGKRKDALKILSEAVRIDPSDQRARRLLSKAQKEEGVSTSKSSRKKSGSAFLPSRGGDAGT